MCKFIWYTPTSLLAVVRSNNRYAFRKHLFLLLLQTSPELLSTASERVRTDRKVGS